MFPRPPLSLSLAGLRGGEGAPWGDAARSVIEWSAGTGFGIVRLDAAVLRARDLDRSARRDVAALLRRLGLRCSGLDLWIPAGHFAQAAHADRAVRATIGALELAADLGALLAAPMTVAVTLPERGADDAAHQIAERAEAFGVRVGDCAFPPGQGAVRAREGSFLGAGIDPAAVLMGGGDPAAQAARAGPTLVHARLSDASSLGRTAPGTGRLDELAYLAALAAAGYGGDVALDLRGLPDQDRVAREVRERWQAGSTMGA